MLFKNVCQGDEKKKQTLRETKGWSGVQSGIWSVALDVDRKEGCPHSACRVAGLEVGQDQREGQAVLASTMHSLQKEHTRGITSTRKMLLYSFT